MGLNRKSISACPMEYQSLFHLTDESNRENDKEILPFVTKLNLLFSKTPLDVNLYAELMSEFYPQIRNGANSDSPHLRYISIWLLLHDDSPDSEAIIWEHFGDIRHNVRFLIVSLFITESRDKLFNELIKRVISDPHYKIRKEALARIERDFSDRFHIHIDNFPKSSQYRLIETFDKNSSADRLKAVEMMDSADSELAYGSAHYLERSGYFKELIETSNNCTMEELNERFLTLKKALDLDQTKFLSINYSLNSATTQYLLLKLFPLAGQESHTFPIIDILVKEDETSTNLLVERLELLLPIIEDQPLATIEKVKVMLQRFQRKNELLKPLVALLCEQNFYLLRPTILDIAYDNRNFSEFISKKLSAKYLQSLSRHILLDKKYATKSNMWELIFTQREQCWFQLIETLFSLYSENNESEYIDLGKEFISILKHIRPKRSINFIDKILIGEYSKFLDITFQDYCDKIILDKYTVQT